MRTHVFASLLLLSLTLTGTAQTDYHPLKVGKQPENSKSKNVKLAVWSAKPGAAARLDPEKLMFGWAIRPPKGFVFTQRAEGTNQVYVFQGDPRPDGTAPALWIVTGAIKHMNTKKSQEEEVMDQYMIQLHQNRNGWKTTPTETGLIQGRKFIRRHWTATQQVNGTLRRLHGIVYLTLAGSQFAALAFQDVDPGSNTSLSTMEPSVFFFRKR